MGDLVPGVWERPSWPRERRLWWLLWSRCPGVGWVRIRALEEAFGGLDRAWQSPPPSLAGVLGPSRPLLAGIERFRSVWGRDPLDRLQREMKGGRGVVVPGDPSWPEGVRRLVRPPLALYWQGRSTLWPLLARRRAVAVVGTRRPSLHGITMARRIGAALAEAGWPVVSGLAEGIDGAAHEGCLALKGSPVAVLGTPLDRVYPRHHGALQQEVGSHGLLLSEHPRGTAVLAAHFATRNRLQVALAAAVVVVECPLASGALHSADLAWNEGLPLWVVPADAGKVSAAGSNGLLARGATPLLTPADLIGQIGPGPLAARVAGSLQRSTTLTGRSLHTPGREEGREARDLLAAVGGGASLEQLCTVLRRPATELTAELLELELAGRLRAEPGLCWRPL